MMRSVLGLLLGIVAGFTLMLLVSFIGTSIYPYPADIDLQNVNRAGEAFRTTGMGYKLFVVLAWFVSSLGGGAVAKLIGGRLWPLWGTIGVMTANAIASMFFLPLPVWMQIGAIVVPLAGGFLATHVGRRQPGTPGTPHAEV